MSLRMEKRKMSFENKHERKQKRRNKFSKEVKEKKFKLYGDVHSKNETYKRKDKYGYDDMDLNY
jgi:hypothetical protein